VHSPEGIRKDAGPGKNQIPVIQKGIGARRGGSENGKKYFQRWRMRHIGVLNLWPLGRPGSRAPERTRRKQKVEPPRKLSVQVGL